MLKPGDKAPAISLLDQDGTTVKLARFKGRKVLVYFYPKADTPGCTTQACGLRDIAGDIGDTAILGISPDKPAKQKKFDDKYGLGFPLLADTDHAVAEAYGVWGEKSNYGKHVHGHRPLGVPDRREGQDRRRPGTRSARRTRRRTCSAGARRVSDAAAGARPMCSRTGRRSCSSTRSSSS